MKLYLRKTPSLIKKLYPDRVWNIPVDDKTIFLTFDDGPHPEATVFVLDLLSQYGFKATFFCVGQKVRENPEICERMVAEGHVIGNHTYNHLNQTKTSLSNYFENVEECEKVIAPYSHNELRLFRPPYGRLNSRAAGLLKDTYTIVMWDYLTGDFDLKLKPSDILIGTLNNISEGSIVLFHDSRKSYKVLKEVLSPYLDELSELGFKSKAITPSELKSAYNTIT